MPTTSSRPPIHPAVPIFLFVQILSVIIGLALPENHFNWVPYDELSPYEINVFVDDKQLSPDSVRTRYHRPARHRENRSIHNLIALVRQYERTYGRADHARVIIKYHTNGQTPCSWSWPEDLIRADEETPAQR